MKDIKIEKKPFSETKHYSGAYTCRTCDQWEDEYQDPVVYEFTAVVTYDNDNQSCSLDEIVWIDGPPRDVDSVEDFINENFFEIIN
jgi:hypothetical protein